VYTKYTEDAAGKSDGWNLLVYYVARDTLGYCHARATMSLGAQPVTVSKSGMWPEAARAPQVIVPPHSHRDRHRAILRVDR
jgi:hypothetical protein